MIFFRRECLIIGIIWLDIRMGISGDRAVEHEGPGKGSGEGSVEVSGEGSVEVSGKGSGEGDVNHPSLIRKVNKLVK